MPFQRIFIALFLSLICIFSFGQEPIFHLDFNDPSGEVTTTEQVAGKELNIQNPFNRPERIAGNFGKALRLDGYGTFISDLNTPITEYSNALTVEVWYATDAFTKEPAAIIQSQDRDGGFKLETNSFGNLIFSFFLDGQERTLRSIKRLATYEWHHIVATLDATLGEFNLYVNGENWLTNSFPANSTLNNTESTLWVGKSSLNLRFAGFSLNNLNGAIDDIKVYNRPFTEQEVIENYELAETRSANLNIDPLVRHANDYLRPQYHSMPNTAWTNEPYGLTYYKGKYHLFFQKNPNGPYLYFMHWGHLSSLDLVTWTEEPVALAPSPGFDDFGVWSGTTILDENEGPILFYTGVDGAKAGIGSALPLDSNLITWQKNRINPLIPNPPPNYFSMDFRDPYLFKEGDLYYMIVGSGLSNNGGGILFTYTSSDLQEWDLQFPLFQSTDFVSHGTFWEMPAMIKLDEENYAIVVTPQFPGAPADVIYWIGTFDGQTFEPVSQNATTLELLSQNLLAPAFGVDENNQWTYIGIIPDDRDVALQIEAGWRHTFSLPRVVRLLDDKVTLASIPHPNLCRLRLDTFSINNQTIEPNSINNLKEFKGNQSEVFFDLNFLDADVIELQVLKNESGTEKTGIILDWSNNRIGLDRRQSSPYTTVKDLKYQDYKFNTNKNVQVRIFIDHSVLEVFVDQLVVFSARVYPGLTSQNVDVVSASGAFQLKAFDAFHLASKATILNSTSCLESDLPGDLFTNTKKFVKDTHVRLFPNPVGNELYLEWIEPGNTTTLEVRIFNLQGQIVLNQSIEGNGQETFHVPLGSKLTSGAYLLTLTTKEGMILHEKFMKY